MLFNLYISAHFLMQAKYAVRNSLKEVRWQVLKFGLLFNF